MLLIYSLRAAIEKSNHTAILSLTALWGFSEAGLGGILHAVRMPFSATLIGAIAIVLLRMIAYFSDNNYKTILGATGIVLLIKAVASPHTPPPAYIAVFCQGFFAAVCYANIRSAKAASVLFGAVALAESALQKLITLTLIFGNNIWDAVNKIGKEVAGNFTDNPDARYALWISLTYVVLYALWGGIVGLFASRVPEKIFRRRYVVLRQYQQMQSAVPEQPASGRNTKKMKKIIFFLLTLIFVIAVLLFTGAKSKAILHVVLRTTAGVLLLLFVLQPLLALAIRKWLSARSAAQKQSAADALALIPILRNFVPDAYRLAKAESSGIRRLQIFLVNMIILTLDARSKS